MHVSDDTGRIAMLETRTFGDAIDDHGTAEELVRYIYSNHLQSASLELDEAGAIISYEEYHPYGTTSYQAMNTSIHAVAKRYRYTGKERDEESGLYYHGARYYMPWLCRWASPDPINSENYNLAKGYGLEKNIKRQFLELTASPYEYCYDSPVVYSDPSGEQPPNPRFAGSIGIKLGRLDDTISFNITASAGIQIGSEQFNSTTFLAGSYYGGSQLGTSSTMADKNNFDLSVGSYLTYASKEKATTPHNFYTLNYNTPSPFKSINKYSFSFGYMLTYNSLLNSSDKNFSNSKDFVNEFSLPLMGNIKGLQSIGITGARIGENFSLSAGNDSTLPPSFTAPFNSLMSKAFNIKFHGTDAGWTGTLTFNVKGVEFGYQNFSGYRMDEFRKNLPPQEARILTYNQTNFQKSLNKASFFIQSGGIRFEYYTEALLQKGIHKYISNEPYYDYDFKYKKSVGIGNN